MASDDEAAPAAFDEEDATRLAKKMKVEELRAALEALGRATEGTKPALSRDSCVLPSLVEEPPPSTDGNCAIAAGVLVTLPDGSRMHGASGDTPLAAVTARAATQLEEWMSPLCSRK